MSTVGTYAKVDEGALDHDYILAELEKAELEATGSNIK